MGSGFRFQGLGSRVCAWGLGLQAEGPRCKIGGILACVFLKLAKGLLNRCYIETACNSYCDGQ